MSLPFHLYYHYIVGLHFYFKLIRNCEPELASKINMPPNLKQAINKHQELNQIDLETVRLHGLKVKNTMSNVFKIQQIHHKLMLIHVKVL